MSKPVYYELLGLALEKASCRGDLKALWREQVSEMPKVGIEPGSTDHARVVQMFADRNAELAPRVANEFGVA